MDRNEIINFLQSLSTEDLQVLLLELDKESLARKNKRKTELWEVVTDALKEYINEFGTIWVNGYDCNAPIKVDSDFGTPGDIDPPAPW